MSQINNIKGFYDKNFKNVTLQQENYVSLKGWKLWYRDAAGLNNHEIFVTLLKDQTYIIV